MKKTLKLTLLAFTLLCSACSTSKQLQTKNTDTVQYQLPACHQVLKGMYEDFTKQAIIDKWLEKKIADTYVRIEDGWRGCDFRHKGWIKSK